MPDPAMILRNAIAQHNAGRFSDAENGYLALLAQVPSHLESLYRLGVLYLQTNRLGEAEAWLQRGLAIQPNSPELLSTLAVVLANTQRHNQAIPLMRRAIALRPAPPLYNNLANMLREAKQFDQAIIEYQRAIALQPNYIEAMSRLGSLLIDLKRYPEAIAVHRRGVAIAPNMAEVHCNLSWALGLNENPSEAEVVARRAVQLNPNPAGCMALPGRCLAARKQPLAAAESFRKAIAHKPDSAAAHRGLGNALLDVDQLEESLAELREAIRLEPDYADTHWDYSLALIKAGRFTQAWPEFEWRHRKKKPNTPRPTGKPRWNGEPLTVDFPKQTPVLKYSEEPDPTKENPALRSSSEPASPGSPYVSNPHATPRKKIFLQGEQAFGDRIQFIRYADLVARAGGQVIIDTLPELKRLFQSMTTIEQIITDHDPIPNDVEISCPVMSLPLIFQTTAATIPAAPYLYADPILSRQWADQLGSPNGKRRIGIVWAGRPKPDPLRSIPLEEIAPILATPDTEFFSLQTGNERQQLLSSPWVHLITDHTTELTDFADTAALMSQLDLIITIDTASAHLAGALGRPVWVLLKHHADYRWMLEREDSPWYPTMKLFRQPAPGDWGAVVKRVLDDLAIWRLALENS